MKKILSFALAAIMLVSMVPTAFATTAHTNGTQVVYNATGTEAYTITVPAQLAPGDEGTVTLSGTWASNHTVKVTADATVTLENSINAADKKVLDVTFAGIEKAGDNTVEKTYTETVSVAAMPADALFGTWNGKFNYNVEFGEVAQVLTLTQHEYRTDKTYLIGEFATSVELVEGETYIVVWDGVEYTCVAKKSTYTMGAGGGTSPLHVGNYHLWEGEVFGSVVTVNGESTGEPFMISPSGEAGYLNVATTTEGSHTVKIYKAD